MSAGNVFQVRRPLLAESGRLLTPQNADGRSEDSQGDARQHRLQFISHYLRQNPSWDNHQKLAHAAPPAYSLISAMAFRNAASPSGMMR